MCTHSMPKPTQSAHFATEKILELSDGSVLVILFKITPVKLQSQPIEAECHFAALYPTAKFRANSFRKAPPCKNHFLSLHFETKVMSHFANPQHALAFLTWVKRQVVSETQVVSIEHRGSDAGRQVIPN